MFEGDDLGVIVVVVEVGAFADDFARAYEDAADLRVGAGERGGGSGERESALHEQLVL